MSGSTDKTLNISGQHKGFTTFLEKESPGHIHTGYYAHVVNLVFCDAITTNHALYLYLDYFNMLRYTFVNHICKWIYGKNNESKAVVPRSAS